MAEFRVHFSELLLDAKLVSPTDTLPPLRRIQARVAKASPSSPSVPTPAPAPAPVPANFWDSDVAREITKDRQQIEAVLNELRNAAEQLQVSQAVEQQALNEYVVEIALTVATRLLHKEITRGEYPLENMLRDLISKMDQKPTMIRLHPKDLQLLEQRLDGQPLFTKETDPKIIADSSVNRASCRVEQASSGEINFDINRQIREVREDLMRKLSDA